MSLCLEHAVPALTHPCVLQIG